MKPEANKCQGLLAATRNYKKGMDGTHYLIEPSVGTTPADTLVLNVWPPKLGENKFRCLSHPYCGDLLLLSNIEVIII